MKLFNTMRGAIDDNLPSILVGIGIVGVVKMGIEIYKATPKAMDILEKQKEEKIAAGENPDDIKPIEKVKAAGKVFLPAIAIGAGSVLCFVYSNHIQDKRQAALAGLYTVTQNALTLERDKMKEILGDKKAQEIIDEAVIENRKQNHPIPDDIPYTNSNGEQLFFDEISGKYFMTTVEEIRKGVNDFNAKQLRYSTQGSLNDFYDYIPKLSRMPYAGEGVGWDINVNGLVEIYFTWENHDGRVLGIMRHMNPPIANYRQR